jgi:hypothetical protein
MKPSNLESMARNELLAGGFPALESVNIGLKFQSRSPQSILAVCGTLRLPLTAALKRVPFKTSFKLTRQRIASIIDVSRRGMEEW